MLKTKIFLPVITLAFTAVYTLSCNKDNTKDSVPSDYAISEDMECTDTLYTSKDTIVCLYSDYNEADTKMSLITSVNGIPISECRLLGKFDWVSGRGRMLDITSGIDTISIPAQPLPDSINITDKLCLAEVSNLKHSRHFALNDSSAICTFSIDMRLPIPQRQWLSDFIQKDIMNLMKAVLESEDSGSKIKNFKGGNRDMMAFAEHCYNEFKRLYLAENEVFGLENDILFEIYPVWTSPDNKLTTYRFQNSTYMGGAHGGMEDYYLTFDNKTGRLLGLPDFFKSDTERDKAILKLEDKLTDYKNSIGLQGRFSANINDINLLSSDNPIKEQYNGKTYPRPAMTRHGIVFSYQPYEMGAFSEGILHFVIR